MESDTSNQLAECEFNQLEKIPNELLKGILIKEASAGYSKLSYYKGKIIIQNEERNYLIREFISLANEVLLKAQNELFLIGILRDMIKIVDVYGFILEKLSEDTMKYILITQAYETSFDTVKRDEQGVANLLYQLALSLKISTENNIFHGALTPQFIYINENDEVLLGNFFWSDIPTNKTSLATYIQLLNLQDDSFLSPETLLLKHYNDLKVEEFDYVGADIYSFGLIGLHLLGAYQPYNYLEGDPQTLIDNIYSKKRHGLKPLRISLEIDIELEEAIIDCLKQILFIRIDYKQLLKRLGHLIKVPSSQTTADFSIVTNREEFDILIITFETFMNYLHQRKDKPILTPSYIMLMKSQYLKTHSDYLEITSSRYLLTKYRAEFINIADGIAYFIRELHVDLSSQTLAEKFTDMIINSRNNRSYTSIFKQLFSINTTLQDYVITGLCAQTYIVDWDYFFSTTREIPYKEYVKLVDIPQLYQEFRGIILHPVVKSILTMYLAPMGRELENIIDSLALERTFILKIQPSLHGLTTYNGNIFLSSFQQNLSKINQYLPAEFKFAILLTLLHELAHLLQRINCKNFKDSTNRFTPKNNAGFTTYKEEIKTENALTENRGESGEQVEIQLLGKTYDRINREAALYFLEGNFSDENFKEELNRRNEPKKDFIYMGKAKTGQLMGGLRCGVSMKIK